jgi:hypothetical protein
MKHALADQFTAVLIGHSESSNYIIRVVVRSNES